MNRLRFRKPSRWLSLFLLGIGIVGMLFFLSWSFRAAGSAPAAQGPYPPPATQDLSDYPPGKQTREALALQTDTVLALRPRLTGTPTPVGTVTPRPTALEHDSRRTAGVGTIIEHDSGPSGSFIHYENLWTWVTGNREIAVYAGAQQLDDGGTGPLPPPLPSLLEVTVRSTEGYHNFISDECGKYYLPVADGPARIVDATGTQLTVVTQSGMAFVFDVATRQFVGRSAGPVLRPAGDGTIVESGAVSFSAPEYAFENQWYVERRGERVTVLAGSRRMPMAHGRGLWAVLFVAVTPAGQPPGLADGTAYLLVRAGEAYPFESVRVDGADGERLILATSSREIVFDLASRQIVSPPGMTLVSPDAVPTPAPPTPRPPTPVPPTPVPPPSATPYP